jgi:hypothetical protein
MQGVTPQNLKMANNNCIVPSVANAPSQVIAFAGLVVDVSDAVMSEESSRGEILLTGQPWQLGQR